MSKQRRPVQIVEFLGLPGTGKTTLSLVLRDRLNKNSRAFVHNQILDGSHLSALKRNFTRAGLILRELPGTMANFPMMASVFRVRQQSVKDRLKAVYNIWTVCSLLARARRLNADLILDQGPLQAIWSLLLASPDTDVERWIAALMPDGDANWHVICLTAERSRLIERLAARPDRHSRMQDDAATDQRWARGELLITAITSALGPLQDQQILTLQILSSEDRTPAELAAALQMGLQE